MKECPKCGCKDGNNAQECTIYYNAGYGKRIEQKPVEPINQ